MNGRKLFREYAKLKGREAKEFIRIDDQWYSNDELYTKDNNGNIEKTIIDYKELVHLIINNKIKL